MAGALTLSLALYLISFYVSDAFIPLCAIVLAITIFVLAVSPMVYLARTQRFDSKADVNWDAMSILPKKKSLVAPVCLLALGVSIALAILCFSSSLYGILLNVFTILAFLLSIAQVIISRKNADRWGMIVGISALAFLLFGPLRDQLLYIYY